ncbi:MAG: hypothetical protein P4L42_03410 [Desulfocapsaceae bacterium]|nr:hypothetical protein [Desulfocapsaceae bacterium]
MAISGQDWLTISETATHLSEVFNRKITEAQVYQYILQTRLKVAVYFPDKIKAQCTTAKPIKSDDGKIDHFNNTRLETHITDLWTLPLYDRLKDEVKRRLCELKGMQVKGGEVKGDFILTESGPRLNPKKNFNLHVSSENMQIICTLDSTIDEKSLNMVIRTQDLKEFIEFAKQDEEIENFVSLAAAVYDLAICRPNPPGISTEDYQNMKDIIIQQHIRDAAGQLENILSAHSLLQWIEVSPDAGLNLPSGAIIGSRRSLGYSPLEGLSLLSQLQQSGAFPQIGSTTGRRLKQIGFDKQKFVEYLNAFNISHTLDIETGRQFVPPDKVVVEMDRKTFKALSTTLPDPTDRPDEHSENDVSGEQLTPGTLRTTWAEIHSDSGMSRNTFKKWAVKAGIKWKNKDDKLEITLENILKVKSFMIEFKKNKK